MSPCLSSALKLAKYIENVASSFDCLDTVSVTVILLRKHLHRHIAFKCERLALSRAISAAPGADLYPVQPALDLGKAFALLLLLENPDLLSDRAQRTPPFVWS